MRFNPSMRRILALALLFNAFPAWSQVAQISVPRTTTSAPIVIAPFSASASGSLALSPPSLGGGMSILPTVGAARLTPSAPTVGIFKGTPLSPSGLNLQSTPASVAVSKGIPAAPITLSRPSSPSAVVAPARHPVAQRVTAVAEQVSSDMQVLDRSSGESSSSIGESHIALLQGIAAPQAPATVAGSFRLARTLGALGKAAGVAAETTSTPPPAPAPEDPEKKRNVRWVITGTFLQKLGMEVVSLGIPLLALQTLGGATHVAMLAIVYGVAQVAFTGWAGTMTDRTPASRVLARVVGLQALLIGALIGAGALGILSPWMLFPVFAAVGGMAGIGEAARRVIPTLVIGQNEAALKKYNSKVHIFYEVAGVAGALLAGLLIATVGPLYALLLNPPAYLLGALAFKKVRHAFTAKLVGPTTSLWAKVKAYFADLKSGAKTIVGDSRYRWVAIAIVLPAVVHRVFENLMLPVFAQKVLEAPATSALMLTASNLGELVGAALLLKFAARFKGPFAWVRWSAFGLLAVWAMTMTTSLPILLPIMLAFSLTWAASDLSLWSYLQSKLPEDIQTRTSSFLVAAFITATIVTNLLLGRVMDLFPLSWAFIGINALFTVLALVVWRAAKKLS